MKNTLDNFTKTVLIFLVNKKHKHLPILDPGVGSKSFTGETRKVGDCKT